MIFKRYFNDELAQASYLIACGRTGEAVVVDPNRDVESYIRGAAEEGVRIVAVTETHIHADFLSGSRELAARTGATLFLSDEGDADWKYDFAEGDGARLLRDGDEIGVGGIRLRAIGTPGHTPEHIAFLVFDGVASDLPVAMLSGDFVFVGDVGRPDLLELAAGVQNTMDSSARRLFSSLQRLVDIPDGLLIWPGHGAGSSCGKALGGSPVTSLGYERATNWALSAVSEDAFVHEVLSGQPEPPRYFAQMKRLNKTGPPSLDSVPAMKCLDADALKRAQTQKALVLDVRSPNDYSPGHVRGSINIPLDRAFLRWCGALLPYDQDLVLVANDEEQAKRASAKLRLIGLDRVLAWTPPTSLTDLAVGKQVSASDLRNPGEALPLDVRWPDEWDEGHLSGAVLMPLTHIEARANELPKDRELLVYCGTGPRSAIAVGLLERLGFDRAVHVLGGYEAYERQESGATP